MTPEIARRCISCGASVRVRAAFCPHCGNRLGKAGSGDGGVPVDESDGRPATDAAPPQGSQGGKANPASAAARRDSGNNAVAGEVRGRDRAVTARLAGVGARVKQHRVTAAARDAVEENLRPRVEKIRQASNVVIDEAADDPSLRFLLIAALLFLISLLILLFSNLLR